MRKLVVVAIAVLAGAITVYAAGGEKRTNETCSVDDDCYRGHCHTKDGGEKVCADCSSSDLDGYREKIKQLCKSRDAPQSCDDVPQLQEAAEEYFNIRINNGDRCINMRKESNERCWAGGDQGHRTAIDNSEVARKRCYDELNTRRGNGGIYTCSDSTYTSLASEVKNACSDYGSACEAQSKDDKDVDCVSALEEPMKKAGRCTAAVEKLDSDCLPRLSSYRETQFSRAKKAQDHCKEVLDYKQDKKLCK
jgi:hypothetical protein